MFRLVDENAKKRFELVFGYDPSPPKPKKKHVQPARKKRPPPPGYGPKAATPESGASTPPAVEGVTAGVAGVQLQGEAKKKEDEPEWAELAFVKLPPPESSFDSPEGGGVADSDGGHTGQWFIRAVQGHSIKLEGTGHLEALRADVEGKARAGLLVHGTRWELWETLSEYEAGGGG